MKATAHNGLPGVCMDESVFYGSNCLARTAQLKRLTDRRIAFWQKRGYYAERHAIINQKREGRLVWSA
jgi:hypothetical protein